MAMSIHATAQTQESLVPTFTATIGGVEQTCVDARLLHAHLKNGRQFADWINARIQKYGFEQGADYELVSQACEIKTGDEGFASQKNEAKDQASFASVNAEAKNQGRGGHNKKDYRLSLDMAKELSMVESNEQGRAARRYFINMERIAIQAIKDQLAQALASRPAIDYERISPAQKQALKELVNAQVHKTGKHHQTVWTEFQTHFRVNKYEFLPAARFDEACKWLGGKRMAAKPESATSYELPAVDFDFRKELTTGQSEPEPLSSAVMALVQQISWKLAAEAQVSILQFLERFIAYRTTDANRNDVGHITRLLESLTLDHVLAHRYFSEIGRVQMIANVVQEMATTCVQNIRQRVGTLYA